MAESSCAAGRSHVGATGLSPQPVAKPFSGSVDCAMSSQALLITEELVFHIAFDRCCLTVADSCRGRCDSTLQPTICNGV